MRQRPEDREAKGIFHNLNFAPARRETPKGGSVLTPNSTPSLMTSQPAPVEALAADVLAGSRRALARALTLVENDADEASGLLAALYPHSGQAQLIGVTGPPGSGKSTLVNALTLQLRAAGETVAVIAVDPTSPFTGGAILGDRIRMRDLSGDAGVFIRSMAARGSLGGLARTTADMVDVLDAAGFDRVLIETVGAGQSEVDIAATAHTTLVVEAPGLGDDVQAIKAGILEIADILVLNKADQPSAKSALRVLRAMLQLAPTPEGDEAGWPVRLLETIATDRQGITQLLAAMDDHHAYLRNSGTLLKRRQARIRTALEARLRAALFGRYVNGPAAQQFDEAVAAVVAREIDPGTAVAELLAQSYTKPIRGLGD